MHIVRHRNPGRAPVRHAAAVRRRSSQPFARAAGPRHHQTPGRTVFSSSAVEPERYTDRGYELDRRRQIHAARVGDWKLTVHPGVGDDYLELYNLELDPLELRNVADAHPRVRDQLLAAVERWSSGGQQRVPEVELSEEELEVLRALGYIR